MCGALEMHRHLLAAHDHLAELNIGTDGELEFIGRLPAPFALPDWPGDNQ